ncbi:MAG: uracil-DNA glycosylase [Pseudomonadota bacterium]
MRAQAAGTLEDLKAALTAFEGCSLKRTAKNLVFGVGNPDARVMFVGEAPGREEDLTGVPFVGRSGDLLNLMLAAIGLERDRDTYIANVVPWRPPGNRTPTPEETELCRPFILRQIELVQPDLVVPLGGAAAKQLLNTTNGILRLRGRSMTCATDKGAFPALATLHPAYLLRQPGQKRLAWQDLLKIKEHLSAGP